MAIRPVGSEDRKIPPPPPDPPADEAKGPAPAKKTEGGGAEPEKKASPVAAARQADKVEDPKAAPTRRADGGITAPTAAAPTPQAQAEALRWAAQQLPSFPESLRKPAQEKLVAQATSVWNGMSPADRAGKSLADFHSELRRLSTPPVAATPAPATAAPVQAPTTPPATPHAQAVSRAESLFTAYKDQSQLALDAAHTQGRQDLVDAVGDFFSGRHLNPHDMDDHVLKLNTAMYNVVEGVRSQSLKPTDFGKKDWSEVDGRSMYDLAMKRLQSGAVDTTPTEKRMQKDPLWSEKPLMINEPGTDPAVLKQQNLSTWNRSPETMLLGNWQAGRAEQLGFMQKARDGAVAVADGRATSAEAQLQTAAALAKGDGVAKNPTQVLSTVTQLTGVPPATLKLSQETTAELDARVKKGEIDGYRSAGNGVSVTYKSNTPQEIAADVMKKLDSGQLDHLSPESKAALRDMLGGTAPGQKLADSMKSEESARSWREFGGKIADGALVTTAAVLSGGTAGAAFATELGLGRIGVAALSTLGASATNTTLNGLQNGDFSMGAYAQDLALFSTMRMAAPYFAAAGNLAPKSAAAAFALRNGSAVLGANTVSTGIEALRQTANGQTPEAQDLMKQFMTNLPTVAAMHTTNAALTKMGIAGDNVVNSKANALATKFAQTHAEAVGTLAKINELSSRAATADTGTREQLATQRNDLIKQFNEQTARAETARGELRTFADKFFEGDKRTQALEALKPQSPEQLAAAGGSSQLQATVEPHRAAFNQALTKAMKGAPTGESLDTTVNRALQDLSTGPGRTTFTAAEKIALMKMASEPGGALAKNQQALGPALANASSGALESVPGVPESLMRVGDQFYGTTRQQASPDAIAKSKTTSASSDPAWWADHGPNHMRDVAGNVTRVLDEARQGGLIAERDPQRQAMMKQAGQVTAVVHDMWMKDLTAAGRTEHPQRAAREAFDPKMDQAVNDLSKGEWGKRLQDVYGVPPERVPQVTREMMAMAYAHSKSNVPLETLNDPAKLRGAMRDMVHKPDPYGQGGVPESVKADPHLFEWLDPKSPAAQANPKLSQLGNDMTDMARALRVGDAFRARGANFHGSQGAPLGIVTENGQAQAFMRLADPKTGAAYPVRYENKFVIGESNTSHSGIATESDPARGIKKGDLTLGVRGSQFNGAEQQVAKATGDVFYDVWKDYAGSFPQAAKQNVNIERPPGVDGDKFAQSVKRSMLEAAVKEENDANTKAMKAQPGTPERIGAEKKLATATANRQMLERTSINIVDPPPRTAASEEAARTATAAERAHLERGVPPTDSQIRALVPQMDRNGTNTAKLNIPKAFQGARLIDLKAGDVLAGTGGSADYVYIPTKEGLGVSLAKGYQAAPVPAGAPVGEVEVLGGTSRNGNIIATRDTQVIAIPKSVYQSQWLRSFYSDSDVLQRLQRDYPGAQR